MVRKLKFHEQKLLKKVDFITWKVDNSGKENKILRRFHIQKREDYTKWVFTGKYTLRTEYNILETFLGTTSCPGR